MFPVVSAQDEPVRFVIGIGAGAGAVTAFMAGHHQIGGSLAAVSLGQLAKPSFDLAEKLHLTPATRMGLCLALNTVGSVAQWAHPHDVSSTPGTAINIAATLAASHIASPEMIRDAAIAAAASSGRMFRNGAETLAATNVAAKRAIVDWIRPSAGRASLDA